jgi:hypothetical protein
MTTVTTEHFAVTSTEAQRFGFGIVLKYHWLIANIMTQKTAPVD